MEKKIITKQAINQVLKYYWLEYKKRPWLTFFGFLLPSIGTLLIFFIPPLIIGRLIDTFTTRGAISFDGIIKYIVLFGVVWLLGEIFWRIGIYFMNKLKALAVNSLSKIAFKKITDRDYEFYTNNFVGSLTKKGNAFPWHFDVVTNILNTSVVGNIFQIIFATIILWRYSFYLPLVLIVSVTFAIFVAVPIIKKRSRLVHQRHEAGSKLSGMFSDIITNMPAVKAFAKEDLEYDNYGVQVNKLTKAFRDAADYQNMHLDIALSPIYVITNIFGLVAAIFFAGHLGLQTGAIIIIFSYYSLVTRVFWDINGVYRGIESTIGEAAEFTQLFIEPSGVQDIAGAESLEIKDPSIHFNHVGFNYNGADEEGDSFLKDFNLEIKANQKVGLIGPSGSGKTTITKLILRFIDIQDGNITISGKDISKVNQQSLRSNIAYVPQDPLLFHRTLWENIAYGNENAKEIDVIHAAKLAHAHEFISSLPNGYQTLVGERGIKLSGGQRQRVAIARALLKNAPILVLDEATSALDSESEKYIQKGLLELMKNKTALVIAHRLSTIKHMDRIIVLDQGKIVQDGTHDELIKKKGLYAKLWSHQSGEFLEN